MIEPVAVAELALLAHHDVQRRAGLEPAGGEAAAPRERETVLLANASPRPVDEQREHRARPLLLRGVVSDGSGQVSLASPLDE